LGKLKIFLPEITLSKSFNLCGVQPQHDKPRRSDVEGIFPSMPFNEISKDQVKWKQAIQGSGPSAGMSLQNKVTKNPSD
jgi:hypothetical protein